MRRHQAREGLVIRFLLTVGPLAVRVEQLRDVVQSMIDLMGVVLFGKLLGLLSAVGPLRALVVLLDLLDRVLLLHVGVEADHLRRHGDWDLVALFDGLPLGDGDDRSLKLRLQGALSLAPREHEGVLPDVDGRLIFVLFVQLPLDLLRLGPVSQVLPGAAEANADGGAFELFHEVVAEEKLGLFVFVGHSPVGVVGGVPQRLGGDVGRLFPVSAAFLDALLQRLLRGDVRFVVFLNDVAEDPPGLAAGDPLLSFLGLLQPLEGGLSTFLTLRHLVHIVGHELLLDASDRVVDAQSRLSQLVCKTEELLLLQRPHSVHGVLELPAERPHGVVKLSDVRVRVLDTARGNAVDDAVPQVALDALSLHRHFHSDPCVRLDLLLDSSTQPVNLHLLLMLLPHFLICMLLLMENRMHDVFHLFAICIRNRKDLEIVSSTLKKVNIDVLLFHQGPVYLREVK